jgi:hypothetical protein
MTACATVADVLELVPNPHRVTATRLRKLLGGIGYERAACVLQLARERHLLKVQERMAEFGVSRAEAESMLFVEWVERQP